MWKKVYKLNAEVNDRPSQMIQIMSTSIDTLSLVSSTFKDTIIFNSNDLRSRNSKLSWRCNTVNKRIYPNQDIVEEL